MARNGSGTFIRLYSWEQDAANNIKIRADRMDAEMDGMADALTGSIASDGQTPVTGNLPMSGFKHTNVADASQRNQYATWGQVQDSTAQWGGTDTGAADAYEITTTPVTTAYAAGQTFRFKVGAGHTNTGASTLSVNGLNTRSLKDQDGNDPAAGYIRAGSFYEAVYDGTNFVIQSFLAPSEIGGDLFTAADASAARTDLGLGTAAVVAESYLLDRTNHTGTQTLSTISDAGTAASRDVGTSSSQVPRNSDLGTASTFDRGTGSNEIPTNSQIDTTPPSNSVGQAELKTTESTNSGTTVAVPGGSYAFWPRYWYANNISDVPELNNDIDDSSNQAIRFGTSDGRVRSRYVTSSPPYDLGDGEVYGFVYARMAADGSVNGMFISQDPAHYGTTWGGTPEHFKRDGKLMGRWRRKQVTVDDVVNGRASLEALKNDEPLVEELEICAETKLRGMDEKPHPFIGMTDDETAVLLDPLCKTTGWIIECMLDGDDPVKLFKAGYLHVSNSALKRCCPPGLTAHKAKWK